MINTILTYKELNKWSEAFVNGSFGLFFLVGNPGHAKSFIIRKLVEAAKTKTKKKKPKESPHAQHVPEPLWIEGGAVSAFKLYQELYIHQDEMVVMDDVDAVYSDRNLVRLLKALCQTEQTKQVGWFTQNTQLDKADIPNVFKTKSRVCIIANHWRTLSEHVGSLISRGVMIQFEPSIKEVFSYIKQNKIITDKEILNYTQKHLWMVSDIDIRHFINAVEAKKAKLDWQLALSQSFGIRDMLLVEALEKDSRFSYGEQRVAEFQRQTNQSRPMYFKAVKKLAELKHTKDPVPPEGFMA